MSAQLLDGKIIAAELEAQLKLRVDAMKEKGFTPGLTVILVGEDPASQTYVSNKEKACERLGIVSQTLRMPADTTQETLEAAIEENQAAQLAAGSDFVKLQQLQAELSDLEEKLAALRPKPEVKAEEPAPAEEAEEEEAPVEATEEDITEETPDCECGEDACCCEAAESEVEPQEQEEE